RSAGPGSACGYRPAACLGWPLVCRSSRLRSVSGDGLGPMKFIVNHFEVRGTPLQVGFEVVTFGPLVPRLDKNKLFAQREVAHSVDRVANMGPELLGCGPVQDHRTPAAPW